MDPNELLRRATTHLYYNELDQASNYWDDYNQLIDNGGLPADPDVQHRFGDALMTWIKEKHPEPGEEVPY
jgi:hypothetical protein